MLENNWLISKRLKGLVLLLLLTSFAQVIQAAEESSTTPLIIESIPDPTPQESNAPAATPQATVEATPEATPAAESTEPSAASTSTAFADVVSKAETFLIDSPSSPEAVKTFLQAHPNEIQWTKEHPLHLNAFALVLAILVRVCCGDTPNIPKPRVPQPVKAPQPVARKQEKPGEAPKPAQSSKTAAAPEPAKNPFQKVLEETLKSPVTPARDTFIVQSYLRWAASEPQPSYQWAMKLDDPAMGRRLLTDALLAEEEKDPSAAFDLALSTLPPELQDPVIDAIVRQWTRKKPQSAADKIAALPSGSPVLQTTIAALVETWADLDIEAAHHWLVALPINLFRDLALSVFIQRLMLESPESAAAWVESIANNQVRQQVAGMVAQKWQTSNPEAANAWVEKTLA